MYQPLIEFSNGTAITYYLSDGLGSVLLALSASAIQGEQLYGPYGGSRYLVGSLTTSKGYTGQLHDALTGLDYYVARYYDPLVGIFLTVDTVQGNLLGFDPYAYVQGNPETMNDPTGQYFTDGSPYDRAVVESDANGDGGHYVLVYIPSNQAAPSLRDEWVNYTHVNKKGEVDVVAGWADNGRRQVQCAFGCNSNSFVLGAGAIALDPAADVVVTAVLVIVAIALLVGIIANAVTSASSNSTAYSWVNKETEYGTTVRVRKLTSKEVKNLRDAWGQKYEKVKGKGSWRYPANADIYVDDSGNYWILPPGGEFLIEFP